MTRSRVLAVVVVLGTVVFAAFAAVGAHRAAATADARADALHAAKTRVPVLLSYHKASLHEDLDRALDQTTGSFADDYKKILTEVVEPTAKRRGISTEASVKAAGVVSGDRKEVVVLLFLTQTTTAKGGRSSVSGSRVEVTLKRSGEDWKIAGLEPV
jgi:Mce-associated membrane protein